MSNDVTINPGHDVGADQIRLYICNDCKQILPIPSDGVPPYKYDYLLHKIEEEHGWRGHQFAVIAVTKDAFEDTSKGGGREKILTQIKNAVSGGETGFGSEFYSIKETFKDDALACWKKHQRNPACSDYMDASKRIQPDTKAERKAAGLGSYQSTQFLCHHCPVHSLVVTAARKKAGLYNN